MKKYISAIFLFTLAFCCHASNQLDNITFVYGGHTFFTPASPNLIASTGGSENIIILRYGEEKGEKYLSFSNIKEDKSLNIDCDIKVFFAQVFSVSTSKNCNTDQINSFRKIFVDQHDSGTWNGEKMTVYYSIGSDQSLLFAFDDDGQAIKIDTDFLNKETLKNMIKEAL